MELVSRMMDGSISYAPAGGGGQGMLPGFRLGQDKRIERLQEVPLFAACTRRQLRAIAKITEIAVVPAGTVLTRLGDPGDRFFLILDGRVRVEVSPRKQTTLRPGEFFGEMSLLDGEPRSATVVAETPARLLVIQRHHFTEVLERIPELTRLLLATLSRRVRAAERLLSA